jgi:hypothetical protein
MELNTVTEKLAAVPPVCFIISLFIEASGGKPICQQVTSPSGALRLHNLLSYMRI